MQLKYFKPDEFNRCTPSCEIWYMDMNFMTKLDKAREMSKVPFILNCAYRSVEYDVKKGRSGRSMHCLGRAVDIRCIDSVSRREIVFCCLCQGLSVGIHKDFIHVDDRENKIMFLY